MTDATPLASEQITQDADELEALIGKATEHDLTDEGRYFSESCNDLTSCRHGETGEYNDQHDGRLVEFLWNHRHHYLSLLRSAALSATPAPSDQDASQAQGEIERLIAEAKEFWDVALVDGFDANDALDLIGEFAALSPAPGATAQDGVGRLTTPSQGLDAATVERCAAFAESMITEFADAENAGDDEAEEAWHGGMAHAARRIADELRALATEPHRHGGKGA